MEHRELCSHTVENNRKAAHSCVSIVPIFNHLQEEEMKKVVKATRPISLKRGESLYQAGDVSDSLYIIHQGKIKIYRLSENGKEQLIRILQPGDFTGELALFTESIHEVYAEAMEKTEICSIHRTDLHLLLRKFPDISLKILSEFSNRLERTELQMTSFVTEDIETRIASYLAQQVEENESTDFKLSMSRKDLASFLGTTPETISRKLAKFEDAGWIEQEDHRVIRILNQEALLTADD
ncbi:Crp/Fnr family transcriptional regulator [Salinicoccus sp. ID82-1]|uniref:HTH-type transcriptional regulator ArcR n=1 Tax=Salinicoccus cyprini TaxID=2493691 RepID=A0A558ARS8_9STAP|nr:MULTISPECIES: Crp/Fnr family transcriptional regulator [Salinicoccus]MCG1009539.1 Crp/Fnr family transcriptional regulator [Salinicoccus sp. ID82-1]TVT26973.1 Crp/Fnr family transcriptional regulator [Salinicoccus cyprini]